MSDHVEQAIARLRDVHGARNDAELARRLQVGQSTVSAWRARGHVPDEYINKFANEKPKPTVTGAPKGFDEIESRAHAIALARFVIIRKEEISAKDIDRTIGNFMEMRPFWLVMHRAIHDIRAKMAQLNVDPATAQVLVFQQDLRDPAATLVRVQSELAEDWAGNPWLADWK